MKLTRKKGWIIYVLGLLITFAIDIFVFARLDPELAFKLAGRLEILWGICWLFYMAYKFDF